MATRIPIVQVSGEFQQLQSADLLAGVPNLMASGTWSNQATGDINMSAYYNLFSTIEIELISIRPVTDNTQLYMRFSADGTTYDSGAANYNWAYVYSNVTGPITGGSEASDTQIMISGASTGSATSRSLGATIKIFNTGSATFQPLAHYISTRLDNSGAVAFISGAGARVTAQLTKGVRFLFSSGNISTGIYRVWGKI